VVKLFNFKTMKTLHIAKEFKFSSAHKLTKYKGKCENLHGHTYRLQVKVKGQQGDDGLVMDFVEMKKIVNEKVVDKLDHAYLNDFFENPTAETIAVWIWDELFKEFGGDVELEEIVLYESDGSWVVYRGE